MANIVYQPYDLRDLIAKLKPEGLTDLNQWKPEKRDKNEIIAMTRSVLSGGKNYLYNKIPFAASFGVSVNTHITFELEAPMAVNIRSTKNALTPNMNLFVNPFWLCYKRAQFGDKFIDDESFEDIAAILLHEYMHLLFNHHSQFSFYLKKGLIRQINVATDCQINQDDLIARNKVLTSYGITLEAVEKMTKQSLKAKESSQYYFEALMKHAKKMQDKCPQCGASQQGQQGQQNQQGQQGQDQNQQQGGGSGQGQQNQQGQQGQQGQGGSGQQDHNHSQSQSGQGSGQGQQDQGQGQQQGSGGGQGQSGQDQSQQQGGGSGQGQQSGQHQCGNCGHQWSDPLGQDASHEAWYKTPSDVAGEAGDQEASKDAVEQTIANAVEGAMVMSKTDAKSLKSRGLVAGEILDRIMNGQAAKSKLPIKAVLMRGAGKLKLHERRTYKRINPRQGTRVDIRRGRVFDNAKNVWTFLDNSGSMGQEEITWAMNEIAAVAKKVKAQMVVYPFDTKVYANNRQYADRSGKWTFTPVGRGGTAFQPVFDYLHNETKANNADDLIIIITDGYGESRVETYGLRNVIWLLVEEKRNTLSVDKDSLPKSHQVAWLDQDEMYRLYKIQDS